LHLLTDARALQANVDGIGRYSLGVLNSLSEIRPDWKLSIIHNRIALNHLRNLPAELYEVAADRFRPREYRQMIPLIESTGADCYLNFSAIGPSPSIPVVLSVHDLIALNVPDYFGGNILRNTVSRILFRRLLTKSIRSADAVSVLSEASLNDLRSCFPGREEKAFVSGAGQDLFPDNRVENCERDDYLLYVGNARVYKNLTRLIVAYSRLKAINPRFPGMKMVVRKDRAFRDFAREVDDCSARDSITIFSGVTDDELRQLYRKCSGLVIPSLKEGFGLPALEAMAAGSPVVASRGTALEELVGDAGILVNPKSVEDIMHGMALLTSQPDLRRRLSENALKRAGLHSWKKTAGKIADRIEAITS